MRKVSLSARKFATDRWDHTNALDFPFVQWSDECESEVDYNSLDANSLLEVGSVVDVPALPVHKTRACLLPNHHLVNHCTQIPKHLFGHIT